MSPETTILAALGIPLAGALLIGLAGRFNDNLRETAYILAAEVAASDLSSRPEERRFMQLLAQRLRLDNLTVAALERAARARHQQVLDS